MPRGLFITGTSTEVGKTYAAAAIVRQLAAAGKRVGVYKPAAIECGRVREADGSHRLIAEDPLALWEAAGRPLDLAAVCPQCFEAPLAPHLASRADGVAIDRSVLRTWLDARSDFDPIVV